MAFEFDSRLDVATEQNMRDFFATLSEKDQRRFAAIEAMRQIQGMNPSPCRTSAYHHVRTRTHSAEKVGSWA